MVSEQRLEPCSARTRQPFKKGWILNLFPYNGSEKKSEQNKSLLKTNTFSRLFFMMLVTDLRDTGLV